MIHYSLSFQIKCISNLKGGENPTLTIKLLFQTRLMEKFTENFFQFIREADEVEEFISEQN